MIQAHRIKPNDTSRVPRRFVWLACQAKALDTGATRVERFESATVCHDGWDARKMQRKPPFWKTYKDPSHLWLYVDGVAYGNSRLVLTAHDLSYHLRLAKAFELLPKYRWKLQRLGMHDRSLTISWRRPDGATLVMVDAASWLPKTVEQIEILVNASISPPLEKREDPPQPGTAAHQVNVVRAAMLHLYDWVEQADLGTWSKTGATMAWNNWRHRHLTHRVIVHDSFEARQAEEASTYSGRCEAWKWGEVKGGPFTEWDLPMAYARACLDRYLPTSYMGWIPQKGLDSLQLRREHRRSLVRAEVVTQQPVLPVRTNEGIVWPIGHIVGWWWEDELMLAMSHGAEVTGLEAHVYIASPVLDAWARWVIQVAEDVHGNWTPVQKTAVKHWSRALIGRFATRYRNWQVLGEAPSDEITLMDCLDHDTHVQSEILMAGGEAFWCDHRELGRDALPAIQSAVISECRWRLWRIMNRAGLDHVVYCDTDSVITDSIGTQQLAYRLPKDGLWGLRKVRSIRKLEVSGPRQLVADGVVRYAGIPRQATQDMYGGWTGERRESLESSFRESRAGEVVSRSTPWNPAGVDHRREHLADGSTRARSVE